MAKEMVEVCQEVVQERQHPPSPLSGAGETHDLVDAGAS
jgi:hypothetical protein